MFEHIFKLLKDRVVADFNIAPLIYAEFEMDEHALDIRRSQMPQLKGFPSEDSLASRMQRKHNGKVDLNDDFLAYLMRCDVKLESCLMSCLDIKPVQSELVASQIAVNFATKLKKKLKKMYLVSSDGYLLDGHHGWATCLIEGRVNNSFPDLAVMKIDLPIGDLLRVAKLFTDKMGIMAKEGTQ